ncbi:VG15 protein [Micromonospora sp. NBC_00421]|uniref:VG15 protein n=1 Tax=Micromonospora sp. NBC_00421 TaxID=2975976 RepID=UPI002E21B2E7
MSAAEVAQDHSAARRRLALAVAAEAGRLWALVDPVRIGDSWLESLARLLVLLTGAQVAAAGRADGYLDEVLDAQGVVSSAAGRVSPQALAGVASDGRDLGDLLYQPVVTTLVGIKAGAPADQALAGGAATLDMIVRTQVADAGRVADQVAMVVRDVPGYRRMLVGRSCARCVVLAGRFYRYNAGFNRHPRCDCVHVPAREDTAEEIRTDPKKFFASLSRAEQDRVFTAAGAEAIRLGADISQVVNARKGARGLTPAGARITAAEARMLRGGRDRGRLEAVDVYGRQLYITSEGVTTRGLAGVRLGAKQTGVKLEGQRYRSAKTPRLMPESILQIAGGTRDEAIRLLKRFGYLL